MNTPPPNGTTFTYSLQTSDDMGAHRFQRSSPPVFATPFLVGAVEAAAARLMEPCLEDGEMSVGSFVELKHTRPTPLGWRIRTEATLVAVEGKRFDFEVECFDETEKVGSARHTRFVIDTRAFLAAVEKKKTQSGPV